MLARLLVAGLIAAGLVVAGPPAALACSCVEDTIAGYAHRADTVFVGTVQWSSSDRLTTTAISVEVSQVYKGKAASAEKLQTPLGQASCGLEPIAGEERWLFFAQGQHPGQMRVNLCDGSRPAAKTDLAQLKKVLGPPVGPSPIKSETWAVDDGSQPTSPSAQPRQWSAPLAALGGLLVLVVLGLIAFQLRRAHP